MIYASFESSDATEIDMTMCGLYAYHISPIYCLEMDSLVYLYYYDLFRIKAILIEDLFLGRRTC